MAVVKRETTLPQLTPESLTSLALPSLADDAWSEPATPDDAVSVISHIATFVEPDMSNGRVATFARSLAAYCDPAQQPEPYTRAELLLAAREVPRDPEAGHNYGKKGLSLPDIDRVIRRHRHVRSRLSRVLTFSQLGKLLDESTELKMEDFGVCDYDADNRPLYRYRKPAPKQDMKQLKA